MRENDFERELLNVARIKSNADESMAKKISTSAQVVHLLYVLLGAVIGLTMWLTTLRLDLNKEKEERERDGRENRDRQDKNRQLLNQLYIKIYGVEVTFS